MGFRANSLRKGEYAVAIKDVVMIIGIITALFIAALVLTETRE